VFQESDLRQQKVMFNMVLIDLVNPSPQHDKDVKKDSLERSSIKKLLRRSPLRNEIVGDRFIIPFY